MFNNLYHPAEVTKPAVELTEEVEKTLKGTRLEPGKWQMGIRRIDNVWRPCLIAEVLEYDILLPQKYEHQQDALNHITQLVMQFLNKEGKN